MTRSLKFLCPYHWISLQFLRLSCKYFGMCQFCIFLFVKQNILYTYSILLFIALDLITLSLPAPILYISRMKYDVMSPNLICIVMIQQTILIRQVRPETNKNRSDFPQVWLRLSQQIFLVLTSVSKYIVCPKWQGSCVESKIIEFSFLVGGEFYGELVFSVNCCFCEILCNINWEISSFITQFILPLVILLLGWHIVQVTSKR